MSDVLDIVLMAGQSNMVGWRNNKQSIASRWQGPIEKALVWQGGAWSPLRVEGGYQKKGYGPELSFAHDYVEQNGRALGIVKVASNATYLSKQWDPEASGRLFDKLVSQARAALTAQPSRLRGLIWMQGEADSINEDDATAYRARFERFITRFRNAVGAPDLPVISGIINSPLDHCPYTPTVQAALSQANLDRYDTISCDGLPKLADNLHYAPRGLSMLGRRFAKALHDEAAPHPEPLVRQWIWNSDQYQAWFEGPEGPAINAVVTFPHAVKDSGFEEAAFAQSYFALKSIPVVHIRSNQSNWFQDDEIFDVTKAVRAHLKSAAQIVSYGASMGAYGALLTSKALETDKVIAIAPQFSIDRAMVPWETRWKNAARKIGPFKYDVNDFVSQEVEKYVVYDPLSADQSQIDMFQTDDTWQMVRLPLASHQVLQYLLDTKSLPLLMQDLFDGGPHVDTLLNSARAARHTSKIYWLSIAIKSLERRPELALVAMDKCQALGGPKRKLRAMRAQIEENQRT